MRAARNAGDGKKSVTDEPTHPEWSQLLVDAVAKPGVISTAYFRFHEFSIGNQLLALWQCLERKLDPGPIHTFMGWKELGRHVKKGEKAITLCMPVSVKRRKRGDLFDSSAPPVAAGAKGQVAGEVEKPVTNQPTTVTVFTYKPHWFLLSQTDGADYVPTELPEWSEERALTILDVTRVPFSHTNGNCQGFANGRCVAVSPVAAHPHKTLIHEIAHVLLGHTTENQGLLDDHEFTPKSLREVEAESVALIVCESLNLGGAEFSRAYIQHWLDGDQIPERSAQRIFKAADQILKAGYSGSAPESSQPSLGENCPQ